MSQIPLAMLCEMVDPARTAVVHGEQRWTFGQLDAASRRLAALLSVRGAVQNGLIAFALPNGPEFLALALAAYRCGATPAPLSPGLSDAERTAILEIMRPCCFLTEADLIEAEDIAVSQDELKHIAASWKACTSGGSTGRPKVIVDGRPAAFDPGMDFIGIPRDEAVLIPGPLYHNAPFSAAIFALFRGNTVVTMTRFDAAEALALIAREQLSWALMVPTMMGRIMALPPEARNPENFPRWQRIVHTAAAMAPWLKQKWIDEFGADHIWEVYGATEGLVRCWIGGREWMERPGSVGRPLGGARLRILDTNARDLPAGALGEIFAMPASGPASTYRYIGAESRTTEYGWESVGDVGLLDGDGYLYLADRRDDLIISGGINIWPAEVEAAILRHPDIRSCAVWGVPNPDLGAHVHALVETDLPLTPADLSQFLDRFLSRPKHPRSIDISAAPVRDDAGKIRKPRQSAQETL